MHYLSFWIKNIYVDIVLYDASLANPSVLIKESVLQIFCFSTNFADFAAKKVIFVNRLNPLG